MTHGFRRLDGSTVAQAVEKPSEPVQALWRELISLLGWEGCHQAMAELSVAGDWTLRALIYHWRAGQLR